MIRIPFGLDGAVVDADVVLGVRVVGLEFTQLQLCFVSLPP